MDSDLDIDIDLDFELNQVPQPTGVFATHKQAVEIINAYRKLVDVWDGPDKTWTPTWKQYAEINYRYAMANGLPEFDGLYRMDHTTKEFYSILSQLKKIIRIIAP